MSKDYYDILGVSKDASQEEIAQAYRNLAIKYHPDKNPDDPKCADKFKEVAEAFEVLNDLEKRARYNRFGSSDNRNFNIHINPFDIFGDIFGDFFGDTVSRARRGADIQVESPSLTLEEAYKGCKKVVRYSTKGACNKCEGTGVFSWSPCDLCGGNGRINRQQGAFHVSITCTRCKGKGKLPVVMCDDCSGFGTVALSEQEEILDIPAGVENGVSMVMPGRGRASAGGVSGDLICVIRIQPHLLYERDGHNLYCLVPITYAQSVLGHQVELPLLNGSTCQLKIPAGVRSGGVLRVRGVGMPVATLRPKRRTQQYGDLLAKIQIDPPQKPSAEYLDLLKKVAALDDIEEYRRIEEFNSRLSKLRNRS